MKKLISLIAALTFILSMFSFIVYAAGSTVITLKTSETAVRTGDNITVTINVNGTGKAGMIDMNVLYNSAQLEYQSADGISPAVKAGELDISASGGKIHFLYLDGDGGLSGIKSADAFRVKFRVKGGNVGDKINVEAQVKRVGDENATAMSASVKNISMTIAPPLSGNTYLSSLTVSNAQISPAFNKNTTSYTASIPFTVDKLNINAVAEDTNSRVSINSPTLTPGADTNVSVTVTAQTGAKKVYTIKVTRAQDPNYKASANNNLTGITVDPGILSPVFSKDKTDYVVWLPFEITKITVTGKAEDGKASVTTQGGDSLQPGVDNLISVICTAENGDKKIYKVVAKRASSKDSPVVESLDKEKLKKDITSAGKDNDTVFADLSSGNAGQLDVLIFNALADNQNAKLSLNLGGATILFNGKDMKKITSQTTYDFTYTPQSGYKDLMIKAAGDDSFAFTYSFAYHGYLPGYAKFTVNTHFTEGKTVNVYKYDSESQKFILIAQDITVGAGGTVSYLNNSCSDYLITTTTIKDAVKSEAVSKQLKAILAGGGNMLLLVLAGVVLLLIGFAVGFMLKTVLSKRV